MKLTRSFVLWIPYLFSYTCKDGFSVGFSRLTYNGKRKRSRLIVWKEWIFLIHEYYKEFQCSYCNHFTAGLKHLWVPYEVCEMAILGICPWIVNGKTCCRYTILLLWLKHLWVPYEICEMAILSICPLIVNGKTCYQYTILEYLKVVKFKRI